MADGCPVVAELTAKSPPRAGAKERQRRAEALRRYRADARVKSMAVAGEVAYLREQLRLAARLTARLATKSDIEEMLKNLAATARVQVQGLQVLRGEAQNGATRVRESGGEWNRNGRSTRPRAAAHPAARGFPARRNEFHAAG